MIFVVCLNWDFWDLCGILGILGVVVWGFAVVCGGGWGSPSGPPPLALAPALTRRAGEGVLLVVDGGFQLVIRGVGERVVLVWGVFISAKVRFASFAALGPFSNGPYGMAVPVFVDGPCDAAFPVFAKGVCGLVGSLRGGVLRWGSPSGPASRASPARIASLARAPLRFAKGAVALPLLSPRPRWGALHNLYGRVLLACVVPRSPFVLRTFPPWISYFWRGKPCFFAKIPRWERGGFLSSRPSLGCWFRGNLVLGDIRRRRLGLWRLLGVGFRMCLRRFRLLVDLGTFALRGLV